jgi:hypothetical protein
VGWRHSFSRAYQPCQPVLRLELSASGKFGVSGPLVRARWLPVAQLRPWLFAINYLLLTTISKEKMTAVVISIVHAACEQLHRIRAIPATVAGAMAAAATPARGRSQKHSW